MPNVAPVCCVCGIEGSLPWPKGWHVRILAGKAWCDLHAKCAEPIPPAERAIEFERQFQMVYEQQVIMSQFFRERHEKRLKEFQQRRARIRFGLPPIKPAQDPEGR